MSNSASVSFTDGNMTSITLFEHWGGKELHQRARAFAKKVCSLPDDGTPLGRLEPSIVMANFLWAEMDAAIREDEVMAGRLLPGHLIKSSFYPEREPSDGDNTNHGHLTVKLARRKK